MWTHFLLIYEPYIAEPSIFPTLGINILMWNCVVISTHCETELSETPYRTVAHVMVHLQNDENVGKLN